MGSPSTDLVWAEFDGAFALFHRPAAKTHFLNRAAFLLLDDILRQPLSAEQAATRLGELMGAPPDGRLWGDVHSLLTRLESLGLVQKL